MAVSSAVVFIRPDDWSFLLARSVRFRKPRQCGRHGVGPAVRAGIGIMLGTASEDDRARMFRPAIEPAASCYDPRGVCCRPIRFGLSTIEENFLLSLGERRAVWRWDEFFKRRARYRTAFYGCAIEELVDCMRMLVASPSPPAEFMQHRLASSVLA